MASAPWMKRNSLEIQFWGYEIGNIIASLTGAGGIRAFAESLADAYLGLYERVTVAKPQARGWRRLRSRGHL